MTGPTPSGLFAAPAPRARSWAAVATSASLHVAAMVLIAALAGMAPAPTAPRAYRPVTFVMMAPPSIPHDPAPPLAMPVVPKAEPEPPQIEKIETPAPVERPKPAPPPPAPKPIARSEPAPAPPEPVRAAPPPVVTPAPVPTRTPPPPVTVGLFADSAPTVHEAEPAKTAVRSAGFDTPSPTGKTGDTKSAPTVGAFDQQAGPPARVARPGAVVASAGFGSSPTSSAAVKPPAEVRPSGFDTPRPAPATQRVTPSPERIDVPVEVTYKPTPIYTEEARALKLEGDVLLDVEFGATGIVSVIQVVRGLGHGLDEAAARAATQMRFKPAQSSGRPIAFRTTVHIVFRLA